MFTSVFVECFVGLCLLVGTGACCWWVLPVRLVVAVGVGCSFVFELLGCFWWFAHGEWLVWIIYLYLVIMILSALVVFKFITCLVDCLQIRVSLF